MFRQISFGAAAVLTVGLVAVGCGEDGDTIIQSGTNDTATDPNGFTTINSNNLAPDGGGLSPDGDSVANFRMIYNENVGSSDGASTADCSAVLLFTMNDGRTFVTHYNATSITPPVELEGLDHDTNAFDIDSACVSFLQTSGYENSVATPEVANAVRQNNGMILLVMNGRTARNSSNYDGTGTAGSAAGQHTALWKWLFNPGFRGTEQLFATTTSNLVGSIPATATTSEYYNAPTNEFRFGWQVNAGRELSLNVGSGTTPAVTGQFEIGSNGFIPGTGDIPASDVGSFGLVTDGNQREQTYVGGSVLTGSTPGRVFDNNPTAPAGNEIHPGEAVNVLSLVYTQIVTSRDQGTGFSNGFFGGSTMAAFSSSFNLATLSFETVNRITPVTSGSLPHNVSYYTSFRSYNNIAVLRYNETTPASPLGGGDPYGVVGSEDILQKIAFYQTATGGSAPAQNQDIAVRSSSSGVRTEFVSSSTNQIAESSSFLNGGQSIYGRDEGLADTVIFFASNDGSSTGGQDDSTGSGNTDRSLYAALLTAGDYTTNGTTGATDGVLATGTVGGTFNPLLLTVHNTTDTNSVNDDEFSDAVAAESTLINRNGEYILVGYVQRDGAVTATTLSFRRTLKVLAYQTVRFGATAPAFNTRFSVPAEVSTASTSTTLNNGQGAGNNETNLQVNAWEFEGAIDYRCGFQSATNVVWMLWEQSDTSEDRLFVRPIGIVNSVTPPTLAGTTTGVVEIDDTGVERVPTMAFSSDGAATPATLERNDVAFVEGGLATTGGPTVGVNNVDSCDLGTAGAQSGAPVGGLFLVYVKTTDNTQPSLIGTTSTGDGDGFDRHVIANAVLLGGTELGRTIVDNNFNEDDLSTGGSLTTGNAVFALRPVGPTSSVPVGTTNQANLAYILFTAPTKANVGNSDDALFLRTFDLQLFRGGNSTGASTDFQTSFVPSAVPASFQPALRLDHLAGGRVEGLVGETTYGGGATPLTRDSIGATGNAIGVIFREDGHDWVQGTQDGRAVLTSGGAPAPALMDNGRSSNVLSSSVTTCENDSCDDVNAIYQVSKNDVGGGNIRLGIGTRAQGF